MVFDPTGPVRTELDQSMNRADLDALHDQRRVLRVLCLVMTLPFRLPFWWRARRRRRRELVRFVLNPRDRGILDAKRIALEWANERRP